MSICRRLWAYIVKRDLWLQSQQSSRYNTQVYDELVMYRKARITAMLFVAFVVLLLASTSK